jgi:hypothetical protein
LYNPLVSASKRLQFTGFAASRLSWLLLGLIVIGSGPVSSRLLDRGHNWGDDFAAYVMQAQSLVQGNMDEFVRRSAFTTELSPVTLGLTTYPWGFPLMLAPVYAARGLDFLAFKLVLTACYMAFLVPFFLLARTRLDPPESLLLTAFLAFNLHLLRAQNELYSDLPFLLWSTLSLWLIEVHVNAAAPSRTPAWTGIFIGLTIFMAAFTRFNGLLLFVPLAVAQIMQARAPSTARFSFGALGRHAIPYAVFGGLYALQAALLPSVLGGLQYAFDDLSPLLVLHHLLYYLIQPRDLLQESGLGAVAVYAPMLTFFIIRLIASRRSDAALLLYALATWLFYSLYPPIQGPRFIYPLLPVFFIFTLDGMQAAIRRLLPRWPRAAATAIYLPWAALAALSLVVSVRDARENLAADRLTLEGPLSPAATALFDFVRDSTAADSVIVFYKPRAMRLFTDRDAFLTTDCDDLPKGDYLVLREDTEGGPEYNQLPPSRIGECSSVGLDMVFNRQGFLIYAIAPPP